MASFTQGVLTNAGLALMSSIIAGEDSLTFTGFVVGDGTYSAAEKTPEALRGRSALKSQKQAYALNYQTQLTDTRVELKSNVTNYDPETHQPLFAEGFNVNEIGIMARATNGNTPVLFMIAVTESAQGDYLPTYEGSNPVEMLNDVIVAVSNELEINIEYDESAFAFASDLDDHVEATVIEATGIHGIRVNNEILQYYNEETHEWEDISDNTDGYVAWIDVTILASGWSGSQYSFETDYPSADFDILDILPKSTTTDEQRQAWAKADCGGYYDTNVIKAHGTAPSIDLPMKMNIKSKGNVLFVPTLSTDNMVYNGEEQTAQFSGYIPQAMSVTGRTGTNAGGYNAVFHLTRTDTTWFDGTTADKTIPWRIAKAPGNVDLSATEVILDADHLSVVIDVSNATGEVTVSNDSPTKMNVVYNGSTITVTAIDEPSGLGVITVNVAGTSNYNATTRTIDVSLNFVSIYGVTWDGTTTTSWTRTDDAASFSDPVPYLPGMSESPSSPFDTLYPWSEMTVENRTGGKMVKIPKFWYKLEKHSNDEGLTIKIADAEIDGYSVSPAHMNRGDGKGERDAVYVGRYHSGSNGKSTSGAAPYANATRSAMRSTLAGVGTGYCQMDFATRFTLWLLYLVEMAGWNSQEDIGYGCGNNSAAQAVGYTDTMPYHTGYTQSAKTTYGCGEQYRNIEGLWDNVYDWLDGCRYDASGLWIIPNPANFSDDSGGSLVGLPTSGRPSKFSVSSTGGFPMFYPTESLGSDSTYSCDSWNFGASYPCLCAGGVYTQHQSRGLFCVDRNGATTALAGFGCRLLELP